MMMMPLPMMIAMLMLMKVPTSRILMTEQMMMPLTIPMLNDVAACWNLAPYLIPPLCLSSHFEVPPLQFPVFSLCTVSTTTETHQPQLCALHPIYFTSSLENGIFEPCCGRRISNKIPIV